MGLDAYVRCNCASEGKQRPGPVHASDTGGMEQLRATMSERQFQARFPYFNEVMAD